MKRRLLIVGPRADSVMADLFPNDNFEIYTRTAECMALDLLNMERSVTPELFFSLIMCSFEGNRDRYQHFLDVLNEYNSPTVLVIDRIRFDNNSFNYLGELHCSEQSDDSQYQERLVKCITDITDRLKDSQH